MCGAAAAAFLYDICRNDPHSVVLDSVVGQGCLRCAEELVPG